MKIRENSPKVLIIGVSPLSNKSGYDTMSSLFSQYDSTKVAYLYIRAELSDSKTCGRYFHIFESRVIKSLFNRHIITGEEYTLDSPAICNSVSKELKQEKKLYENFKTKRPWSLIFLRELIWKFGRWKTEQLNNFLDNFAPEVVFFPIESYIHLNRITEYIIERCKPQKVIPVLWDDNFTYKQSNNIGFRLHRFWLRKHAKSLINRGDTIIVQNNKTKRELMAEYGRDSVLLTKPIFNFEPHRKRKPSFPLKILYTGSLYIKRDQTIIAISEAINRLNSNRSLFELNIYSGSEPNPNILARIERCRNCHFNGKIAQNEVFIKQSSADILLFVEDLSNKNLAARLSFSTKITDYLKAGKCILAIGNEDLAPIEYFKEYDAGLVCTQYDDIYSTLEMIVGRPELVEEYARKAHDVGLKNHNGEEIIKKLYDIICA